MSARSALEFLCEKYRRRKFASDAIDWAVAELMEGNDSESLRRLAATLKPSDWWEVEPLLQSSFAELGYPWLAETDCYWACAEATARDIVAKRIDPSEGCARMYLLCVALNYPSELIPWDHLCADLRPESLQDLSADDFPGVVEATAAAWLRSRQLAPE